MVDAYSPKRQRVASIIKRWKTGTVTLIRVERASPSAETPWIPGAPTETSYVLDAVVRGVTADMVDESVILATDLVVVVSPKAHLSGALVDVVPQITDKIVIDGAEKIIKKIEALPAAGLAARFHIFVAS